MTQASNLAKGGSNFNADGDLSLTTGVTGTLPVANGGTGSTTTTGAANAILPSQTSNSGKYLTTNGTDTSWGTVTSNPGTVTSVNLTAGTAISVSGGPITSSGSITVTNTGVTSVTGAGTVSVSASTGGVTITGTGGSGTVTSVATGNGLSGGTITSTGTLVVACPTFNTVGSYCMVVQNGNFTDATWSLTAGGNYGVGSGIGGVQAATISQNNGSSCSTDYTAGQISGTWKWMGAGYGTVYWQISQVSVACRVS
jgi:hypothetical protein